MSQDIYPLTFTPVFKDYIWGGRNLETKLGRQIPPGIIAESWEISGHPSSPTRVAQGALAGQTLPQVLNLLGEDLVGYRARPMLERGKFPLLVKLLDANRPLSVQVHPNDDYAAAHEHGELGKTEMWYILHAEPNARLIYGLKQGTTPELFRDKLSAGTLEDCLHYLPIKPGDAIFIPAGSIHALLEGALLAEIQQNSDTTYRVYDWNRLGADGKPRPLHINKAMDVINFDQIEPDVYTPQLIEETGHFMRHYITACPQFNVERITFKQKGVFAGVCDGSTFEIWGAIAGPCQVAWQGQSLDVPAVGFALLPAALGDFAIEASADTTLLRAYLP
jgi:mannose-6-phosphate isomerase